MARLASVVLAGVAVALTVAICAAGEKQDEPAPTNGGSQAEAPKTSGEKATPPTAAGNAETEADRDVAAGLPKQWIDAADARIRPQSDDLSRWWHVFNDPLLDELVREAYSHNATLQNAKARSDQAHSQLEYDEALVSVLADVAADYVLIRQFQEQIHRAKEIVELQKLASKIVEARFRNGRTSQLDVDQSSALVLQSESQIPRLEFQLRKAENRLCVLLGKPPADIQKRLGDATVPDSPLQAAVGSPSDILQRRPDILRAKLDSTLAYREAVLKASEEVENAVASCLRAQDEAERLRTALKPAKFAFMIAVAQYQVGTLDFGDVAKVERNLFELANQEAEARARIDLSVIQVYRALGGGWQIRLAQAAPASSRQPPMASRKGPIPIPSLGEEKGLEGLLPPGFVPPPQPARDSSSP